MDMPIDIRATHNVLGHDYAPVYADRNVNDGRTWASTAYDKDSGVHTLNLHDNTHKTYS